MNDTTNQEETMNQRFHNRNGNRSRLTVAAICLVALLALPGRLSATTFSGSITNAQSAGDDVILSSMTSSGAGTVTQTGGTWLYLDGTDSIGADVSANFGVLNNSYPTGSFTATQTAGTFSMLYWYLGAGSYILNNGTISNNGWFMQQGGQFTMNNGTLNANAIGISASGGGGFASGTTTMTFNGGKITSAGVLLAGNLATVAGEHGVVVQAAAATVAANGSGTGDSSPFRISVANATSFGESSYTIHGGSLTVNNGDTKIYQWGKLAGYGTVTTTSARTLDNSGKVVADGSGSDANVLNLSQYGTVLNSTENGTERTGAGWYAQNHGKVTLPSFAVAGGSSTKTWGESTGDTTIDLVNSARLAFTGVTGGTVAMSLLAPDRTDVPVNPRATPIGVWDIDGSAFTFGGGSVALTLRYDNTLVSDPSRLALFHYTGGQWQTVASTIDPANFLITGAGITSFSDFEVGVVPEPSTILLFGLGGLLAWRKRGRTRQA